MSADCTEEPTRFKATGTKITWRPDIDVFTDIDIPAEYFINIMRKQAVVNSGVKFVFNNENEDGEFEKTEFLYENGITDYLKELSGDKNITAPVYFEAERRGRDREDKPEYKVKLSVAFCFNPKESFLEYYHNSSFLEHGGSPDKAVKSAFVSVIDQYLKANGKYSKNESKILFADIADCLCLVSSSFSTITSYENQTKKSITNKFIQEAMTDFLKQNFEVYLIENKTDAEKIAEQVLINKRSRESAEKAKNQR